MELFFDERLVVPDAALSVRRGHRAMGQVEIGLSDPDRQRAGQILWLRPQDPWKDLPQSVRDMFMHGSGKDEIPFRFDEAGRIYEVSRQFEGVIPNMERRLRESDSAWVREEFEKYQNNRPAAPATAIG